MPDVNDGHAEDALEEIEIGNGCIEWEMSNSSYKDRCEALLKDPLLNSYLRINMDEYEPYINLKYLLRQKQHIAETSRLWCQHDIAPEARPTCRAFDEAHPPRRVYASRPILGRWFAWQSLTR